LLLPFAAGSYGKSRQGIGKSFLYKTEKPGQEFARTFREKNTDGMFCMQLIIRDLPPPCEELQRFINEAFK
jgi:hypothetical protein